MTKKKTLLICILYIILFLIVNFGTIILFSLFYSNNTSLEANTPLYIEGLANFLSKYKICISLFSFIFLLPIIYKKIKDNKIIFNLKDYKNNLYFLTIGVTTSLILNILLYDFNMINSDLKIESFAAIISTSIIGPILEELIFRGIIYNKLKKVFSIKSSIIIVSILFGLFHLNIVQSIYVLIFSMVITYCYEKTNNLFIPILVHCSGNLAVSLLLPLILNMNFFYIKAILLGLIIISVLLYRDRKYKADL